MKMIVAILLSALTFIPAPEIQPGDPFDFDPALCPSSPVKAIIVRTNVVYNGEIDAYDKDGDDITFVTNKIVIDPNYVNEVADPNDPQSKKRTYKYTYLAVVDGLHYENVAIADKYESGQPRTIVFLSVTNTPPVISGCR
jgi:hypothetical protein